MPSGYTLVDAADCIIYQTEVIKFFIARKNKLLDGIYVYNGFQEKYLNKFGVGSTVQELKDYFRDKLVYDEMDNSYSIVDVPGIDFSRDRTYNDQEAIIKGISVF